MEEKKIWVVEQYQSYSYGCQNLDVYLSREKAIDRGKSTLETIFSIDKGRKKI